MKGVSFRAQLKGSLSDYLRREGLQNSDTEEGLLELVVALSHYTEEGHSLFPQVLLCDDLDIARNIMQCSDTLTIGEGNLDKKTVLEALKRCAPLARGGWFIYLERKDSTYHYGVLRRPFSPTALGIRDIVLELNKEPDSPRIIIATELANKAVELVGSRSGILNVFLSAVPEDAPSPHEDLDRLVTACCSSLTTTSFEPIQSFFKTSISNALRYSHGALVAVLESASNPDELKTDGVIFQSPISLSDKVEQYESLRNDQALAALNAYGNLLSGVFGSDGIVVLDSECRLRGYNIFIKEPEPSGDPTDTQHKKRTEGGARHRAFQNICRLVDNKVVKACYIRSSDSSSKFYEGTL